MIPRLILRRRLVGTHNNSQQNLKWHPAGALEPGIKRAQKVLVVSFFGRPVGSPRARTHLTIYLNGRSSLPDDPVTS